MSERQAASDPRIAIVDAPFDCDESERPFGKRWRQETISLTAAHIEALRRGQLVAVDVQQEYVVYLKLDAVIETEPGELGDEG